MSTKRNLKLTNQQENVMMTIRITKPNQKQISFSDNNSIRIQYKMIFRSSNVTNEREMYKTRPFSTSLRI